MNPSLPGAARPLRVLFRRTVAASLRLLILERDAPFRAGQVLGLTTDPAIPPRFYSIASGENDEAWEILYSVEVGGQLTPRLAELDSGDHVQVSGPSGNFEPGSSPGVSEVWVAGGTGIAPFLAAVRSGRATTRAILLHAASEPALFYGSTIFEELLGERYLRCSSRAPDRDPRCFRGRATALIESRPDLPLDRPWLLCGPSEFVVDTRDLLISLGLPYSLIGAEVYF